MKQKNIVLIITCVVLGLASCKKASNYPIVGKWQQIKLRTYTQSYSGVISNDTSYLSSSFSANNYAQFNKDGTCVIGIFYLPGTINPMSSIAYLSTANYNYAPVGPKYVMNTTTTLISPSGFVTTDTASINANTLLIHSVFNNHQDYTVSDSYYTK